MVRLRSTWLFSGTIRENLLFVNPAATDAAVAAAGKMTEALETLERARGHLYSFHQLVGGADLASGSGLQGLADRVEALDGRLVVSSVDGAGTVVQARIPV